MKVVCCLSLVVACEVMNTGLVSVDELMISPTFSVLLMYGMFILIMLCLQNKFISANRT